MAINRGGRVCGRPISECYRPHPALPRERGEGEEGQSLVAETADQLSKPESDQHRHEEQVAA
jgi:hypothetical protein